MPRSGNLGQGISEPYGADMMRRHLRPRSEPEKVSELPDGPSPASIKKIQAMDAEVAARRERNRRSGTKP